MNYPLYLILGNTAFQLMNDATTMGMRSIIDASSLLKKVRINRVVFPVQKVLFAVVNYLFCSLLLAFVMLVFRIPLTIYSLLTPICCSWLVFASVFAMLLSALTVFFRDVIHLWSVVTTACMVHRSFTPLISYVALDASRLSASINVPLWQHLLRLPEVFLQQAPFRLFLVLALVIGLTVSKLEKRKFILHI